MGGNSTLAFLLLKTLILKIIINKFKINKKYYITIVPNQTQTLWVESSQVKFEQAQAWAQFESTIGNGRNDGDEDGEGLDNSVEKKSKGFWDKMTFFDTWLIA